MARFITTRPYGNNINLQRADRMGMLISLELRVPFFDTDMIDLCMKMSPSLKIKEENKNKVEKWILRKAFEGTSHLPDKICGATSHSILKAPDVKNWVSVWQKTKSRMTIIIESKLKIRMRK